MARNSPCSGVFTTISEIISRPVEAMDGMTVRVTGRMVSHDFVKREAVLGDTEVRAKSEGSLALLVDTSLVEPLPACHLMQVIGEMECLADSCNWILRARVVRDIDGLDMTMWTKAVRLRAEYLASREEPS